MNDSDGKQHNTIGPVEIEIKELLHAHREVKEALKEAKRFEARNNPNNPNGWSGISNASYYREAFALELKGYLDTLADAGPSKEFYFDAVKARRSPKTIQSRFNQAFLYLVERLDTPDKKYEQLRSVIEVARESRGVRIRWKPLKEKLEGELLDSAAPSLLWYEEFEAWLDMAEDGMSFTRTNVRITGEEQTRVRDSLMNLGNFHIIRLDDNQIKIVREDKI